LLIKSQVSTDRSKLTLIRSHRAQVVLLTRYFNIYRLYLHILMPFLLVAIDPMIYLTTIATIAEHISCRI